MDADEFNRIFKVLGLGNKFVGLTVTAFRGVGILQS
jgi:hypothetical protein